MSVHPDISAVLNGESDGCVDAVVTAQRGLFCQESD